MEIFSFSLILITFFLLIFVGLAKLDIQDLICISCGLDSGLFIISIFEEQVAGWSRLKQIGADGSMLEQVWAGWSRFE